MIRRFLAGFLAFLVTAVAAYMLTIVGYSVIMGLLGVPDRDGGSVMAVALVFAPLSAMAGGIIGLRILRSGNSR